MLAGMMRVVQPQHARAHTWDDNHQNLASHAHCPWSAQQCPVHTARNLAAWDTTVLLPHSAAATIQHGRAHHAGCLVFGAAWPVQCSVWLEAKASNQSNRHLSGWLPTSPTTTSLKPPESTVSLTSSTHTNWHHRRPDTRSTAKLPPQTPRHAMICCTGDSLPGIQIDTACKALARLAQIRNPQRRNTTGKHTQANSDQAADKHYTPDVRSGRHSGQQQFHFPACPTRQSLPAAGMCASM